MVHKTRHLDFQILAGSAGHMFAAYMLGEEGILTNYIGFDTFYTSYSVEIMLSETHELMNMIRLCWWGLCSCKYPRSSSG